MNPYDPVEANEVPINSDTPLGRHLIAALPCLLPLTSIASVYLVVMLERNFGVRGAIFGDFSTAMGALFTIPACLTYSALLWAPAGLFASVMLSGTNTTGWSRLFHPVLFVGCCLLGLGLLIIDPGGTFNYYFD